MVDASLAKTTLMESIANDARYIIIEEKKQKHASLATVMPLGRKGHSATQMVSVHVNRGYMVPNVTNANPGILDSQKLDAGTRLFLSVN